jgi:hypothetical protein
LLGIVGGGIEADGATQLNADLTNTGFATIAFSNKAGFASAGKGAVSVDTSARAW